MSKHVMLDLETLGVTPRAAILQVGAVGFDETSVSPFIFDQTVEIEDAARHGQIDGSTVKWWMEQEDIARRGILAGKLSVKSVLENFSRWVIENTHGKAQFWAHATFDFPILFNAHDAVGLKCPFHYKQTRDLRTLESLSPQIIWDAREGVHHRAADDAVFQARHAMKMLWAIQQLRGPSLKS